MHDPQSVAFEIYLGRKQKKNGHYRTPFITIWHCDPDLRGDDDSCGWFIRSRHIDAKILEKVKKEFEFNFKHNYWFNSLGLPKLSTSGTVLNMYNTAAWQIFMYLNKDKPDRKRHRNFMNKHLFDILYFAENPTDSLNDNVNMNYGLEKEGERISDFVSIITADIMRKLRPWYKHPRWHIHHWRIQFPGLRDFHRKWFKRCDMCHKRAFKTSAAYGNWDGTKLWCETCNRLTQKVPTIKHD